MSLEGFTIKNLARFTEGTSDKVYGWAISDDEAVTFYGRFGNENVTVSDPVSLEDAETTFNKKVKKGYEPVDLTDEDYAYLIGEDESECYATYDYSKINNICGFVEPLKCYAILSKEDDAHFEEYNLDATFAIGTEQEINQIFDLVVKQLSKTINGNEDMPRYGDALSVVGVWKYNDQFIIIAGDSSDDWAYAILADILSNDFSHLIVNDYQLCMPHFCVDRVMEETSVDLTILKPDNIKSIHENEFGKIYQVDNSTALKSYNDEYSFITIGTAWFATNQNHSDGSNIKYENPEDFILHNLDQPWDCGEGFGVFGSKENIEPIKNILLDYLKNNLEENIVNDENGPPEFGAFYTMHEISCGDYCGFIGYGWYNQFSPSFETLLKSLSNVIVQIGGGNADDLTPYEAVAEFDDAYCGDKILYKKIRKQFIKLLDWEL